MEKVDKLIEELAEEISKAIQDEGKVAFSVTERIKALTVLISARASAN
ncbi:MAG: hypothetical protein HDQ97_19410 [Lachnospiraceae bacterium]|nr:hypothetical protein [Lachnospiraceae bacterium]